AVRDAGATAEGRADRSAAADGRSIAPTAEARSDADAAAERAGHRGQDGSGSTVVAEGFGAAQDDSRPAVAAGAVAGAPGRRYAETGPGRPGAAGHPAAIHRAQGAAGPDSAASASRDSAAARSGAGTGRAGTTGHPPIQADQPLGAAATADVTGAGPGA